MTRNSTELSTFAQKTKDILEVTEQMRNLFTKLNSKSQGSIFPYKSAVENVFGDKEQRELSEICHKISELRDLNTLMIFENCFGAGTKAGQKITNYYVRQGLESNQEYKDFISFTNESFKTSIEGLHTNISEALNRLKSSTPNASAAKMAHKWIGKSRSESSHLSEEQVRAIQMNAEDPIDRFVIHINNNLQNLTKLDIEISKLLALKDNKELRAFRDDVRSTFDSFKEKLLDPASFLMLSGKSEQERINSFAAFIGSTDYQAMAYVIADIKFRFTNHIGKNIMQYENELRANTRIFNLPNEDKGEKKEFSLLTYQTIREKSGITQLESSKLEIENRAENSPLVSVVQKISDINAYMDGMISVKALLEARHKKSNFLGFEKRPNLDRKKVSNAILLGLDPDLGFDEEIKRKYGENYNAYISGCIEECLVTSSPELFSRNQEENFKGMLQIHKKDATKRGNIQTALGMPVLTADQEKTLKDTGFRDQLGFVDITKFNLASLENQFERSQARTQRTLGMSNYTEPLWRILAAIKPMESIATSKTEDKSDPLYQKISNYQRIIETMKIYLLPYRGRARVNLDLDNAADLKQQGRGVIDRMMHIINMHQKELSDLPTNKLQEIQTTNKSLFKYFETDMFYRGLKKFGKGFGEAAYYVTHGQVPHNPESEHKRRKMQYLKLESEISEQVGANEFAANKSTTAPKQATQYVQEKLSKNKDALSRYVQLKDEDLEIKIQNWIKERPGNIDERQDINNKILEYVEANVEGTADSHIKEHLKSKMQFIYENIKLSTPRFEQHIEKFNSPTLLLSALSEEINKERSKIDPLDMETDILKMMKPVEGKVIKELSRAEKRQALLEETAFFAVDINRLTNDDLMARCEMCKEKTNARDLSDVDRLKYYTEWNRCLQKIDNPDRLMSTQRARYESIKLDESTLRELHKQIDNSNQSSPRGRSLSSESIFMSSHEESPLLEPDVKLEDLNECYEELKKLRDLYYDAVEGSSEREQIGISFGDASDKLNVLLQKWNHQNPDAPLERDDENFRVVPIDSFPRHDI